ncbi:hypothetical protein B0H10DRAFT_1941289 [Mycena sp. CBHHK59/15]|nr:hypothetical protein B0H10DRAFT_1941289 [Mycena sp. CBHHK59/15]
MPGDVCTLMLAEMVRAFSLGLGLGVPAHIGRGGVLRDKYAWAENDVLKANTKSADCQAFFGEHIEHRGYKCSLCPQVCASGSSLTTRRRHLGKEHLPEYLTLMDTRKLPNKLPDALIKQRKEQRARDLQHTAFSIQAFEDQLITVFVSNDLSINLIENCDFRDLLLLLRESVQDGDIPHRTKLRTLILDSWLKYYDKLKCLLVSSNFGGLSMQIYGGYLLYYGGLLLSISFMPNNILLHGFFNNILRLLSAQYAKCKTHRQ